MTKFNSFHSQYLFNHSQENQVDMIAFVMQKLEIRFVSFFSLFPLVVSFSLQLMSVPLMFCFAVKIEPSCWDRMWQISISQQRVSNVRYHGTNGCCEMKQNVTLASAEMKCCTSPKQKEISTKGIYTFIQDGIVGRILK